MYGICSLERHHASAREHHSPGAGGPRLIVQPLPRGAVAPAAVGSSLSLPHSHFAVAERAVTRALARPVVKLPLVLVAVRADLRTEAVVEEGDR